MPPRRLALLAAASMASAPALAHTGAGAVHGFGAGLSHPFLGLDHILAMVAVGLWAGLVGGRARIAWPLAFLGMMAFGGALGMAGLQLPGVEFGIAASVAILGAAIALNLAPPLALGAALCGGFALFHGFAHGAELPAGAGGAGYAAGFLLATAGLHGLGLLLAQAVASRAPMLARIAGGGLVLAGAALLAG